MADLVATGQTTRAGEDVIVRAVQFFTNEKWRAQTQSARSVTFVGRPPIPWGLLLLTIIAFFAFIVPGIIMYILVVRRVIRFQNLVVTTTSAKAGTEVNITYPKHARKAVDRFIGLLPVTEATAS